MLASTMRRSPALLALLALLTALAGGLVHVPAARASGAAVLKDCNLKSHLTRTYSVGDLRQALSTMSVDVKEYSNCYDLIHTQLLAQIGASRRTGVIGGAPGSGSFLPTPLIVVLVVLALGAGGFAVVAIRRRPHP